ncbi:MAG TPA: zf-HC2 domain-containing protein, partial [Terriglobales bacterium]|nr:zf-HC2 domain-containing protein [Terriglobales bacterium]
IEVWRHLSDYVDNDIDADLKANMSAHFENCDHCTAILDGTRNVVALVGDGKSFELSAKVSNRLYDKLNQHLEAEGSQKIKPAH